MTYYISLAFLSLVTGRIDEIRVGLETLELPGNRNLEGPFSAINNYGCWCFFGANWRKGKGKYVNDLDQACHDLHDCYKCSAIDADNENSNCEAATEPYVLPGDFSRDKPNKVYGVCKKANRGDKCKIRACSCEIWFMKKVGQILTNVNYTAQPEFHHNNGFSLDQCEPTGGVEGRRECCGYYPERFPFNYQIGKRCCYDKVYDGNVEKCCSGGKIMETCDTF